MKENTQIRNSAWQLLWNKKWIWRLLCAYILLEVATQTGITFINRMLESMGICSPASILNGKIPELSAETIVELTSSVFLCVFIYLILVNISAYGTSKIMNRAADDNSENWMKAAFDGFKIPLDLAWLGFRISLVYISYTLPSLVLLFSGLICLETVILPEINIKESFCGVIAYMSFLIGWSILYLALYAVPFYKYRYLFRIKADNPDWSAKRCMRRCRAITSGEKWRIFKHDCSYWKIFLFAVLPALGLIFFLFVFVASGFGIQKILESPLAQSALALLIVVSNVSAVIGVIYNGIGQSLLYRKISSEKQIEGTD